MQKFTQNERVLDHLINHGYITQTIASNYGIRRLASRIDELRKVVSITTETRRDDAGVRYARYSLTFPSVWVDRRNRAGGVSEALKQAA